MPLICIAAMANTPNDGAYIKRAVWRRRIAFSKCSILWLVNSALISNLFFLSIRLLQRQILRFLSVLQVFSTATAFYIPLCAIIIVYYKIMRAAKRRFRRERDRRTLNRNADDKTRGHAHAIAQHDERPLQCGVRTTSAVFLARSHSRCGRLFADEMR